MRLMDRISQCSAPFMIERLSTGARCVLEGPADFSAAVRACPARYVLGDDLVGLGAQLAYSKGMGTAGCLDLLHVPAESVWVEWSHQPFHQCLQQFGIPCQEDGFPPGGRRGVLVASDAEGRRGQLHSFWSIEGSEGEAILSPVVAHFDLAGWPQCAGGPWDSEALKLVNPTSEATWVMAQYLRFKLLPRWAAYYREACVSNGQWQDVVRRSLGTVIYAIPVLFSFFLLLGIRAGLPQAPVPLERLNRSRIGAGRPPLLDCVEVRSPLAQPAPAYLTEGMAGSRRGPRLHHVRGHLVRRGTELHWRLPHWRGHLHGGRAPQRTVTWTVGDAGRVAEWLERDRRTAM
jgi:hypothetical protein